MLLNIFGVIIFISVGVSPFSEKNKKNFLIHRQRYLMFEDYTHSKNYEKNTIFSYALHMQHSPIYKNNTIDLIDNNVLLLKHMLKLIREAEHHIHISTYIIHNGIMFDILANELIKKAKEGVKIRIMYDDFGAKKGLDKKIIKILESHKIQIKPFNILGYITFNSLTNYRNHKKVFIVDNKYAIYGGSNIGDEYLGISKLYNSFTDTNFVVKGEIVTSLNASFIHDWDKYACGDRFSMEQLKIYLTPHKTISNANAQFISALPDYRDNSIYNSYVQLFINAKKSIKLITPYFNPPNDFFNALEIAAANGVEIEIITPADNDDKKYVQFMNRSNYAKMLNLKCKIYELSGFIHSKFLLIDDQYVFTGSSNIDFRSFFINLESSLLIESTILNSKLNKQFEEYKSQATLFTKRLIDDFFNRRNKFIASLLNVSKPLL
ncbi:MAG: phosphatidylserine/phosphatidylglycerophosphate/cardiolipin synthase family protein [Mycoplasmataceae bacterium]|nr:phosphatidylserine/phosphatidylglycerophosphate/cardiolipin synthase family protein [Mycoplasmataceae bacterium]